MTKTVNDFIIELVNGRGYVGFAIKAFDSKGTTAGTYTLEYDYYTNSFINVSDSLILSSILQLLGSTTVEFNDLLNELCSIQIIDFIKKISLVVIS